MAGSGVTVRGSPVRRNCRGLHGSHRRTSHEVIGWQDLGKNNFWSQYLRRSQTARTMHCQVVIIPVIFFKKNAH